jgi:hypothetical protein
MKIDRFRGASDKILYDYILTPSGLVQKAEITGRFLKRKIEEYDALKQKIKVIREETNSDLDTSAANAMHKI